MRPVEYTDAFNLIIKSPEAEKGYEDLKKYFVFKNMIAESEAIDFLIKEKFYGDGSNINKK